MVLQICAKHAGTVPAASVDGVVKLGNSYETVRKQFKNYVQQIELQGAFITKLLLSGTKMEGVSDDNFLGRFFF